MTDGKTPVQSDGGGTDKDAPLMGGNRTTGESGGGAYPNPHTDKAPQDGPFGHGGQTEIDEKLHPGEPKND